MTKRKLLSNDDLAEIASQYDVLKEFREKEPSVYVVIHRRGLFDKLCGRMKRAIRDLSDYDLAKIASNYHSRKEFSVSDPSAYLAARVRGILDKVCSHMEHKKVPYGYWTKDNCHLEALKYDTRHDFQKGSKSAYSTAVHHGWLDDICGHMIPQGNWTKRKIYVFTFSDGYAYVGLTNNIRTRKNQHISAGKKSPVHKHYSETGASFEFKVLTDEWLDMDVAGRVEDDYIKLYAKDGWRMLNKKSGGGLGSTRHTFYTPNKLRREVAKYDYLHDFRKKSPKYYKYIQRHGLIEEYCSELKRDSLPSGYWTLERAKEVVPECKSRHELAEKYHQAYEIIKNAGLLTKYYPHKIVSKKKIWTLEKSLSVVPLCNSRRELQKKYHQAYDTLLKAGRLNEFYPLKCKRYTDEEKMQAIADCKTRTELHNRYPAVYKWLLREGRMDVFFPSQV